MERIQNYYNCGIDSYFADDFKKALIYFTQAINIDNENPNLYLKRAYTYNKLNMRLDAIADLKQGLLAAERNPNELGIKYRIMVQIGQWCLEDKMYEDSYKFLSAAKIINESDRELDDLLMKLKGLGFYSIDNKSGSKDRDSTNKFVKPRYDYYQNESYVNIDVYVKNVKDEDLDVQITPNSLTVDIEFNINNPMKLEIDHLMGDIIPEESFFYLKPTKIEIKLKKATPGMAWSKLEGDITERSENNQKIRYPSSSSKAKNWEALEKEIEKEDSVKETNSDISALFSKIYSDADDDTRRAMIKSYVESNGTALSTNWGEVGKGPVKVQPPKGMEPKSVRTIL
ncbi:hypothetical protein BB559_004789 [Furculomyces boomerangus]|uniref:CS domain-containing protein n=1 Tax=Furculomyces boomerangus TaxID=61424 RepID=A0A2T9YCN1_9FUNG|nr:hypothetical protein BB559_004789 [Furculomyces boomerangus]